MKWLALSLALFSCCSQGAVVKAVTELFYPYQKLDKQNQLQGYAVDVVQKLAEINGDKLSIELLPWSVAYQTALAEPGTMIFSIGKNQLRTPLFNWIGPIAKEKLYFWALPSTNVTVSDHISDYQSYRFAVIKEATTHQFLRANGFENLYLMGGTDSNASEESRIQMLLKSRADIVISTQPTIYAALESLGYPKDFLVKVHRAKSLDSELYVAFSNETSEVIVSRYSNAMVQLMETGELETLATLWDVD